MDEPPPHLFRLGMRPWRWLVVLLPTAEVGLVNIISRPLGEILFPRADIPWLAVLVFNLNIAGALCWAVGIWLSPHTHWASRIFGGLAYGMMLAILNGGIAFAGCALLRAV